MKCFIKFVFVQQIKSFEINKIKKNKKVIKISFPKYSQQKNKQKSSNNI